MIDTVLILGDASAPPEVDGRVGRFDTWSDDAAAWFDAELASARVGWRCTVIGPRQWVRVAEARAFAAGAVPEEVSLVVTDADVRRVYCPSCAAVSSAPCDVVRCDGCSVELAVGEHFSPVLAAHLGTRC